MPVKTPGHTPAFRGSEIGKTTVYIGGNYPAAVTHYVPCQKGNAVRQNIQCRKRQQCEQAEQKPDRQERYAQRQRKRTWSGHIFFRLSRH
jgi:hypothetical protein